MPESLSAPEVAHHALEHQHGAAGGLRADLIEIGEAILLAIVAVATAWSGYQTARWDGQQAHEYGLSNKYRAAENRAATRSGQQKIYDTTTFGFWLESKAQGNAEAAALFRRRFRPEYRRAFVAWIRLDPLHNPKAPAGPLLMPQYHNAAAAQSAAYSARATAAFSEGTTARERGEKYLRNTVLLATVLFLTALAQRFKLQGVRIGLLGVSAVLLVLALYYVATYPRT